MPTKGSSMSINLAQLRAFHAVARHGGITAAAQALGVSRPAVTMQVKALEDDVGHPLFTRNGYRFELNEAGLRLFPTVSTLSRLLRETDSLIDRLRDRKHGSVRIGACAPFVLVPTVAAFRRRHPTVGIEASIANSSGLKEAILVHGLDIGIATFRSEPSRECPLFYSLPLVSQTVRAVVARDHPLAGRRSVPLDALAGDTAVLREPGSMTRLLLSDAMEAAGLSFGDTLEFGSREAVKEAVAEGMGVGFVLDREIGVDPRLVALDIVGVVAESRLVASEYVFCHRDLAEVGLVRDFLDSAQQLWHGVTAKAADARPQRHGHAVDGLAAADLERGN